LPRPSRDSAGGQPTKRESVIGQLVPSEDRSLAPDGFNASILVPDKAKRIADIEARHAADDARRMRVLRAWGPLYHLAGRPQTAQGEAAHWRIWAERIIDLVASLKTEGLLDRLNEITTGKRDTLPSRAAKNAALENPDRSLCCRMAPIYSRRS